jgi:hypothetical protein
MKKYIISILWVMIAFSCYSIQYTENKDTLVSVKISSIKEAVKTNQLYQNCIDESIIKDSIIDHLNNSIKIVESKNSKLRKDNIQLLDKITLQTDNLIECKKGQIDLNLDIIKEKQKNKKLTNFNKILVVTSTVFFALFVTK